MAKETYIPNDRLEKYLDELLHDYGFSRTEIAKILHADVDDIRSGIGQLTLEQEKTFGNFTLHMKMISNILDHQEDPRMTADWFFKNIDDDLICSPFDMYMTHGFLAVRDMIRDVDQAAHIRKFYPEYVKTQQEIIPVVMGDGTVRLVVKNQYDM